MLDPSTQRAQVLLKVREVFSGMDPMPGNVTDVSEGSSVALATPPRPALWLQAIAVGLGAATTVVDWLKECGAPLALSFAALWMTCKIEGGVESADESAAVHEPEQRGGAAGAIAGGVGASVTEDASGGWTELAGVRRP